MYTYLLNNDLKANLKRFSKNIVSDRAISDQICDERTKFDILCAFVNVSLCLTHRKHSIQRALNSPGSGEPFKYVEHAWKVHKKFFRDIQSQNFIQNTTIAI